MLITAEGEAVLVDWPWARRAAPVVDVALFAPTVAVDGGPGPEEVLQATAVGRAADAEAIDAMTAAFTGLMQHRRRLPAPAGIPTVRAFQARQGETGLAWLAQRLRW